MRRGAPKRAADSASQSVDVAAAAAPQRAAGPEAVATPEADADGEASSVEGEYCDITGLLEELAEAQPAAGQWAAQLPSRTEGKSSFDADLRRRARQLLGYIATLKSQKTQRKDNIMKIHDYSRSHSVLETKAHLRKKAARQLRELHETAQAHRPDADAYLQALNAAQNGNPHAEQLLLWGFRLLDPTRSQTAMWRVRQGLLRDQPVRKKCAEYNNRAKATFDDVWQMWQRKAAAFLKRHVGGISSGSCSSRIIPSMFSASSSAASHTLAAPQREVSLPQDQVGNDDPSHAAASSVAGGLPGSPR